MKSSSWDDMRSRIDRGQKPVLDVKDVIASVDVSSFTVTVNNGSGIEGAAAEARSVLESNGFKVESVGNASQAVYDETLVVYQNKDNAEEHRHPSARPYGGFPDVLEYHESYGECEGFSTKIRLFPQFKYLLNLLVYREHTHIRRDGERIGQCDAQHCALVASFHHQAVQ